MTIDDFRDYHLCRNKLLTYVSSVTLDLIMTMTLITLLLSITITIARIVRNKGEKRESQQPEI